MKDRPRLIHLIAIAIALLALAAAAWAYTSAYDPVEGIPESKSVAAPTGGPVKRSSCHEKDGLQQCYEACELKRQSVGSEYGGEYDGNCYADCDYRCQRADEPFVSADVYFPKIQPGVETMDCGAAFPIRSSFPQHGLYGRDGDTDEWTDIIDTTEQAESALVALLVGPTVEEKNAGYFTSIPEGVKLNSIGIDLKGIAKVDFSKELAAAAGSCRVTSIRAQIEKTTMQFPIVKSVVITIEGGNPDEALQP